MDDDNVRRGSPSCHVAFGESSAILAGDALQSLAFEILSKKLHSEIPSKIYLNWVNYLSSSIGLNGVAGGQYLDLSINGKNAQINKLKKIYDLKTAHLIKPCIMLPLMISRFSKDKNVYENFQKFGTLLGISFQIKDDLLGYTSSSEVLGKTKNKDEIRNQPNFVNILGVEETKNILKENKESMRKILINNNFKNSYLSDITNYIFERKF
jgi:farnesyl diphosphate synthase